MKLTKITTHNLDDYLFYKICLFMERNLFEKFYCQVYDTYRGSVADLFYDHILFLTVNSPYVNIKKRFK